MMSDPRRHLPLTYVAATLLLSALSTVACAGVGGPTTPAPRSEAGAADAPPPAPDLARLEALYRARADSALQRVSDADAHFMTGMIHHHAQALVMSAWAPTHGANASVLTLTARITNAQKDEITVMQRWLRERDRPVPEVDAGGKMAPDSGMQMPDMDMTDMQMPGMLSPQQLLDLSRAHGVEYDRLFLTYMIQHHNGAVTMVHELFATDGAAQDDFVFKLASDIQVDQTTEVARMQQMLDGLPSNQDR
ncbi:MAG: DUF305 domain-containing protein [Gemmatimonadales bacterium]|nr:DUF305 domain-containing protein [Gemmatimonadales bacterium]